MQRTFLSNLGLILILNLLIKPFYILGIDAEVQNAVGPDTYGLYFTLLNLGFLFNILIDFGINNFNNRNIAQNMQLVSKHFSKLFSIKAMLSLVYAFITLAVGWILGYRGAAFFILAVLAFNQILVSFIQFSRSNLAALHLFRRDSLISVLDRGLLIVLCGSLLFTPLTGGRFEIEWFVYLQTLAYGLTLVVAMVMLARHTGKLRLRRDRKFTWVILRKSFPYALFMFVGALYTRIDGVMLEQIGPQGSRSAGEYAQGYRFYEAAGMFAYLFAVLLLPIYSRLVKERPKEVKPMVETASRLLLGSAVATSIFFYFHADFILHWRYDVVSENAVRAFVALMVAYTGVGMFYVYGTLMTANENLRMLNVISFGGLALNLVMNFILIPRYGAFGAALATMATQLFAGGMQLLFVVRHFRFGVNVPMVLQFGAYIGFMVVLNTYVVRPLIDDGFTALLISAVVGVVLLFVTGLFSVRKFVSIFRSAA